MTSDHDQPRKSRPLLAVFLLFTVPFLISTILTPYLFNGLRALGEVTDNFSKLTDARFERVASRFTLIIVMLILYPIIKMTGLLPTVRRALTASRARFRELGSSIFIGCVSISLLYGIGIYVNAYAISPKYTGILPFCMIFIQYLVGAVFIGVFEEIFFRGFVYGGLRSRLGYPVGMMLSGLIFSSIHFLRPLYPEVIQHASWNTGFVVLPYMFERFVFERDIIFAVTLFMMALTLATFYEKRGNLYYIIGLHGGWVLAMRTGSYFLDRQKEIMPQVFGPGDLISKGWLALVVVTLFFVAALMEKKRPDPAGS